MAARGSRKAADQPQGTDSGEGLTAHPTETPDRLETATDDAPEGMKLDEPRMADVGDYSERSYAEALTPEHADRLREAGQHPDQQES